MDTYLLIRSGNMMQNNFTQVSIKINSMILFLCYTDPQDTKVARKLKVETSI